MFPTEPNQLTLQRKKPRSPTLSLAYRVTRLGVRTLGRRLVLRFYLFLSWVAARLALELAQDLYGDEFRDRVMGVTDEMLETACRGAVVVDLGCGSGRVCRRIASWAKAVMGIDIDPVRLEMARRQTTFPNVEYRLADVTVSLGDTFGGQPVDTVLAIHVIEHVEDARGLLEEVRTFAPTAIVEVPDFSSDPLNAARWRERLPWYSDADHVQEYTVDSLTALVEEAGWSIESAVRRGGTIAVLLRGR